MGEITILQWMVWICVILIAVIIGFVSSVSLTRKRQRNDRTEIEAALREQRDLAKTEIEQIRHDAEVEVKDRFFRMKTEFEKENRHQRDELQDLERRLRQREENLERKINLIEQRESSLNRKRSDLDKRERKIRSSEKRMEELLSEQLHHLERIAGMSAEQAKQQLIETQIAEAKQESAVTVKKLLDRSRDEAEAKAREIIATAIQRGASEQVVESTVSVVNLPNDEMKGRIIGREGRNIRALESATGIDLIIDDTPEAVILSSFNAIRREIAAIALKRLISDGRIHPARIEEVVKKVEKEMDTTLKEIGEQAAFDLGIHGIHADALRLLGRLKYRTSYSQNVLIHSQEVAHLAGVMAEELGADAKLARRAGLLHDIGKAVDHQVEGSHAKIGGDLARKYGESKAVVEVIMSHHNDQIPASIEAVLIQSADALSAARPGARREILETYIKRLTKLESLAESFQGVEKSYAIQAGREIRIIVHPDRISDAEMVVLGRDIAAKVESELEYPGEIRVTLIRETRAVEYAR